jgi:hypothetical protein
MEQRIGNNKFFFFNLIQIRYINLYKYNYYRNQCDKTFMRYLFTRIRLLTSSRCLCDACFSYAYPMPYKLDYKGSSSVNNKY